MKILVLGHGRFGSLWGRCLMPLGSIQAYDSRPSEQPSPYPLLNDKQELHQAILQCDVLFFCVPISELEALLEELQPIFASRTQPLWLMDTCSVKVQPMQYLQNTISPIKKIRYLGLHPMFGPDSVAFPVQNLLQKNPLQKNPLHGLRLVLCPPPQEDRSAIELWRQRFEQLGLRVIQMSAEAHDEEAARTQGLTHLLGRVLEAFDIQESPIATTGYQALCKLREQTCHDTWQLFLDLQHQNNYTPVMRQKLQKALAKIYASLE